MKRQSPSPTTLHGEDRTANEQRLLLLVDQIQTAANVLKTRLLHPLDGEATASLDQHHDWEHTIVDCLAMSAHLTQDTDTPITERVTSAKQLLQRMERLLQTTEHWKTILLDQYQRLVHDVATVNAQLQRAIVEPGAWRHYFRQHALLDQLTAAQTDIQALVQLYPNVQELWLRSQAIPPTVCADYQKLQQQIQDAYDQVPDHSSVDNYKRQQLQLKTARLKTAELLQQYPGLGMTDATCAETETILTQAEGVTGLHRVAFLQELSGDRMQLFYSSTVNRYQKLQSLEPATWRLIAHRHWQALCDQTERQIAWLATRLQAGEHHAS